MLSPFPASASHPGSGTVHLTLLPPSTPTFSTLSYTYPLKLLPSTAHRLLHSAVTSSQGELLHKAHVSHGPHPDQPGIDAIHQEPPTLNAQQPVSVPLLFMLTYGGGLVAGDHVDLTIKLDHSTRLTMTTQGSTKVFRPAVSSRIATSTLNGNAPNKLPTTHQSLYVNIGPHAGLWLAPDPVQPYAGSLYVQKQIFEVASLGSVGIVDWVTEGRKARGESWNFESWKGRNEIWEVETTGSGKEKKKLLLRDSVILSGQSIAARMDSVGVFGTVILRGPLFKALGNFFVEEFKALPRIGGRNWGNSDDPVKEPSAKEKWRSARLKQEDGNTVLWTACHVRGCTTVKFSAREVEGAKKWLGSMLEKEGSIARDSGPGGLMFAK